MRRALRGSRGAPAGGLWAPNDPAALWETVSPSLITVDGSNHVQSWTDSTEVYTAAVAGAAPALLYPDGVQINGYDGVEFSETVDEYLVDSSLLIDSTDTYAIYMAVRLEAVGGNRIVCAIGSTVSVADMYVMVRSAGTLRHFRDGSLVDASVGLSYPGNYIIQVAYDGTNSHIRVTGGAESSAALATGTWTGLDFKLGSPLSSNPAMQLYALGVYLGASGVPASATLRNEVFQAFKTRFGL